MPVPPYLDDEGTRPSHVRFARDEQHIYPRPHRRSSHRDPRDYLRRSTDDNVGLAIERMRHRYENLDQRTPEIPDLQSYSAIDAPLPSALQYGDSSSRPYESGDFRDVQNPYEQLQNDTGTHLDEERRFTESPPPIEVYEARYVPEPTSRPASAARDGGRSRQRTRSSNSVGENQLRRSRSSSIDIRIQRTPRSYRGRSEDYESYSIYGPKRGRAMSWSSDYGSPYDKFSFATHSHSVADSSRDGDSDPEASESTEKAPPKDDNGRLRTAQATDIHSSQYTGDAEYGGLHSATLRVIHDPKGKQQPLFRWLHIRQEVMNLDELWTEMSRLSGLSILEKKAITRLKADVNKTCVKSRQNPKGAKVGYLEPRSMEVPLKLLKNKTTADEEARGSARWICLPYFSLEKYSGLSAASEPTAFPAQTLLQIQYSRNTSQRDMEQAVCQLGSAERGECFHIAQLWCLIIDDSLMVTCGAMTQAALQSNCIKIHEEPSRQLANASQGRILVSYRESVVWSFDAAECATWFAFRIQFKAFWSVVEGLEFWLKDQAITAKTWPKILRLASTGQYIVRITMKKADLPEAPRRAVLRSEAHVLPESHGGKGKPQIEEYLHVLNLPSEAQKRTRKVNLKSLESELEAAEKFLAIDAAYSDGHVYRNLKESSRQECYNHLAALSDTMSDSENNDDKAAYDEAVDIFNVADILFNLFLPDDFSGPTSTKFWGAVWAIVHGPKSSNYTFGEMRRQIRNLSQHIIAFQSIVAYSSAEERADVALPSEFVTAWLYVIMSMVFSSALDSRWQQRFDRAYLLILRGMEKLLAEMTDGNLLEKAATQPLELFSLMAHCLLQDRVGKSDDICETYSQYLNSLENSISSRPSHRAYQHRVDLVRQEISGIKNTLWKQRMIISGIQASLTAIDTPEIITQSRKVNVSREYGLPTLPPPPPPPPPPPLPTYPAYPAYPAFTERFDEYGATASSQPYRQAYDSAPRPANDYMGLDDEVFLNDIAVASKLSPTDPGGLRGLFMLECSRFVEQRESEFRKLEGFANSLDRTIAYKMDSTRDRQERAIYAFTLVTIIFLPISAVSSIFGMNTTDVRDMEYSQGLYWAVALPLTFFIIVAGLWFMGELGNLARWFARKSGQEPQGVYGGPPMMPQTYEPAYWPGAPSAPAPEPKLAQQYVSPTAYAPAYSRPQMMRYTSPTKVAYSNTYHDGRSRREYSRSRTVEY